MKVTFEKEILTEAIIPAMSAVSSKNTLKAIEGIQLVATEDGFVTVNSFDLEKGIRCKIKADVEEGGSYIINAMKFSQILRSMPSPIHLDVDDHAQAKIYSGLSEFTLSALPGDEFPNTPMLEGDYGFAMEQKELRDMINKTFFAVASADPRPALNGILFRIENNKITLVSSDSFRLAICEKEMDLKSTSFENKDLSLSLVVPGKTVGELMKMLGDTDKQVRILATKKHIIFIMGNLYFFSRLINTEYIEYEKFIPRNPKTFVTVEREQMLESLERAALVSEDKTQGKAKGSIVCRFEKNCVKISSTSQGGSVYDEVGVELEGEPIEIGMHCRYLLDALRAADSEKIEISLVSPLVSIVMEPVKENQEKKDAEEKKKGSVTAESYTFLVVPVRL